MSKVISTQKVLNVYTRYEVEHDPTNCSNCKGDRGCQYTAEKESYKLGYTDIEPGIEFDIEYQRKETVELKDKDEFFYSVKAKDFRKCFKKVKK